MHRVNMWPKIIHLLVSRGFSQRKLAELAGVDQSTISRIADGRLADPRFSVANVLIELAGGAVQLASEHGIHVGGEQLATPDQAA